jgi:hypothetical protein
MVEDGRSVAQPEGFVDMWPQQPTIDDRHEGVQVCTANTSQNTQRVLLVHVRSPRCES